jgi:shikimate kinase
MLLLTLMFEGSPSPGNLVDKPTWSAVPLYPEEAVRTLLRVHRLIQHVPAVSGAASRAHNGRWSTAKFLCSTSMLVLTITDQGRTL